jgi:hypothetical protein
MCFFVVLSNFVVVCFVVDCSLVRLNFQVFTGIECVKAISLEEFDWYALALLI